MKKIKLFILLLLISTPIFVKADAGTPILSYEVRISNKEGAFIYEWDDENKKYYKTEEKLSYDTTYQVMYERIINNELYAYVYSEDKTIDTVGDCLIKLSDTTPLEFILSDYKKDDTIKYLIFEEGIYLYQGPSKIYGKITPEVSLPVNTEVETKYYDDMWAYVEYNGKKGWIYTYTFKRLSPYNEAAGVADITNKKTISLKTLGPVKLYSNPKTKESILKIPTGTVLNDLSIFSTYSLLTSDNEGFYLIEYDGKKGWISEGTSDSNLAYLINSNKKIFVTNQKGVTLYKNPNSNSDEISTIPHATILTPTYSNYNNNYVKVYSDTGYFYQVNYDGKIGWIKVQDPAGDDYLDIASEYEDEAINFSNRIIYKNINDLSTKVLTLPNKTDLTPKYYVSTTDGTWCFVEYEEQQGWIYLDDSNHNNSSSSSNLPNTNPSSGLESSSNELNSSSSPSQKILVYMVTVIVLSLTAFVTIILINKSKKDQNATK